MEELFYLSQDLELELSEYKGSAMPSQKTVRRKSSVAPTEGPDRVSFLVFIMTSTICCYALNTILHTIRAQYSIHTALHYIMLLCAMLSLQCFHYVLHCAILYYTIL